MANQIQRLPVIEWQPEPTPVARTYSVPTSSTINDFGTMIGWITGAATLIIGLSFVTTVVDAEVQNQTTIHRSN